ncbi:probable metal-nicotianamine transporter YSL7 [Nicotiana tomentosiformis]|uniref:probable metal-nicotianamine transporter YSL7 n=1 Tax=Nicotiana tomentosiformis TaxID=4098 RepID=UPI00388C5F01
MGVESGDNESTEYAFRDKEVPPWEKQITLRSMVTGLILSVVFNFIVCKLNLTTGVIPSLNVAAGLLGFAMIRSWTAVIEKFGKLKQPFTRQENTVIQTCVVASSGIAFSSGTASYMLGMSPFIAAQADAGNTPNNTKKLDISWMLPFLLVVSFAGLFSIVALRKLMIMKYKLTYPSGTATAYLINCFHTPKGAKLAKKQVGSLFKSFGFSFIFGAVQWIFAREDGCGFGSLPTFGFNAYAKRFYFDFSSTYVGVGMLCPYMVNVSLLIGAIISWAIMWPMIEAKKGDWYSDHLSASSLHGIQGYRVFIAIAMMLGDGLFHFAYMLVVTTLSFKKRKSSGEEDYSAEESSEDYDTKRQNEYFLKDQIPIWAAIGGYVGIAVISIIVVPIIFHSLKWYHILVAYVIAPVLAFCNSYGSGLTDWSLASNYGKIAILTFSYWVGLQNGGVIAGLASCGLVMSILDTAAGLMGDFKTGYLTLTSPRSMFFSQVIGTAMGCVITPLVFWIFHSAYKLGDPEGSYPAPYALMYRGIALLGVEGFGSLPKHCLRLSIWFFVAAIMINLLTQLLKKFETKYRIYRFVPSPMCMAIPFYLGGYFAIDMCIGSLILFIWEMVNKQQAKDFGPAVASGLICGESLWGIPASVLALAGVKAPFCMKVHH